MIIIWRICVSIYSLKCQRWNSWIRDISSKLKANLLYCPTKRFPFLIKIARKCHLLFLISRTPNAWTMNYNSHCKSLLPDARSVTVLQQLIHLKLTKNEKSFYLFPNLSEAKHLSLYIVTVFIVKYCSVSEKKIIYLHNVSPIVYASVYENNSIPHLLHSLHLISRANCIESINLRHTHYTYLYIVHYTAI